MDKIKRIPCSKLEVGMYISDNSVNVADGKLQKSGLISRIETLEKLKKKALEEVYIDTQKGKDSPFSYPIQPQKDTLKPTKPLKEEIGNAKKVYKEAVNLVGNLLKDIKLGAPIDVGPVKELANDINESVLNNPSALQCMSQIREKDRYLLEHSINVGILMGIFGRHLGYDKKVVHTLVTGGILHDIGKIRVPNQILNKPGKLTPEEWQEMQNHVIYGVDVLEKSKNIDPIIMDVCRLHHERLDGSGYPKKLNDSNINNFGRIAAIVDVYDAITADRVYHKGKSPDEAIKFLLTLADHHLDKPLLYHFIRCMSIYPVGTLVKLSNGKLGVVTETNPSDATKPRVKTFYNARHQHYEKPQEYNLNSKLSELSITEAIDPRTLDIKVADFLP